MIRRSQLSLVVLVLLLLWTHPARAGTYDVVACDAAPGFANNAWTPLVRHRGSVAFTACPSSDVAMKGLGARTSYYRSRRSVRTGAAARWIFSAPMNTAIVGIRANAFYRRISRRWQVGISNEAQLLVGCPASPVNPGGTCMGGMSAADYVPLPSSSALYAGVYCAYGPCPVARGWYGWLSLTWVAVTVSDSTAPSITNPGGDLWSGSWLNGTRRVTFDAGDNTGIKEVRVLADGREMARQGRGCDPTVTTCPNWPAAALDVSTRALADGKHSIVLDAVDRGDNHGTLARDLYVDNTAPAAPHDVVLAGGDGWKPQNRFALSWTNPPQDAAPIAGIGYRLCPTSGDPNGCVTGTRDGADLTSIADFQVPRPGDWTLTLWLRDAAGNVRPDNAAPPVYLRFDPEPPTVGILPQDPEDPARVRVQARDATSGIVRGEVELRRRGAAAWRPVGTQLEQGGFSAVIDDERLRDGVYEVRARAWDAAGNERSTDRRVSGESARVVVPLRIKTHMRVGKREKLRVRGARGRHIRIVYIRRPVVRHGKRVRIKGRLVAPGGNALVGAPVDVSARMAIPGVAFQPVARLTTSRQGRFAYLVPSGPSRIVRFRYEGAPTIRSQTRDVHVRVRAASSIQVDRRRVVNGEAVTFSGKLRGGFIPPAGKLMELQFFDRGKWRTFRTFSAAPSTGQWSYSYRFDGTRGTRRYRFRVRIPKENGYPFSTGRSRPVAVTVRGL